MKYTKLMCPNCGAPLKITKELRIGTIAHCPCCDTEFTVEEGPERYHHAEQLDDKKLVYGLDEFLNHVHEAEERGKRQEEREQKQLEIAERKAKMLKVLPFICGLAVGIASGWLIGHLF